MVAWMVAGLHPELVRTLTILNAPHPSVFDHLIRHDPGEQHASHYQFYFDTVAANGINTSAFFKGAAWYDEATQAAYESAYSVPGALSSGLNYYRANIFGGRMNVKAFTPTMRTNFPPT